MYSIQTIKLSIFFLSCITTVLGRSMSNQVEQNQSKNFKLTKFIFDYQAKIATIEWSNYTKLEIEMKQIDDDDCIYMGSFLDEEDSKILMTGCYDEIKNIQIQSFVHGYVVATININDTVTITNIKRPQIIDKIGNKPGFNDAIGTAQFDQRGSYTKLLRRI